MHKLIFFLLFNLSSFSLYSQQKILLNNKKLQMKIKKLDNGMTILVVPRNNCAPVCIYLIYNVGSKHEKDGKRGVAHLIEHMIFKGTNTLSETDIKAVINKLSGDCNAHTSMDYTGYYFNVPITHWKQILPIMADCMQNASFKEDHLTSEMKVVVQELKMDRDDYQRQQWQELLSMIFPAHPYHYPVIGFKQDLWNLHSDDLHKFYKKYYHPNNAALVVVGDVDPQEVFKESEQLFGNIPAGTIPKNEFHHMVDISTKTATLYRDVAQPKQMICYVIPYKNKIDQYIQELIARLLTSGKNGLLTKKLVEELKLVNYCWATPLTLFEQTLFLIGYEPRSVDDVSTINQIIHQIIDELKETIDDSHLKAIINQKRVESLDDLQDNKSLALQIGHCFWAFQDPKLPFHVFDEMPQEFIKKSIVDLLKNYFRVTVCHQASVLPLPDEEKDVWCALQKQSDADDERIMAGRKRVDAIEAPHYANKLTDLEMPRFSFAKPEITELTNGIKVLSHHTDDIPKIELILELKVDHYYEPDDKEGIGNFVCSMLKEGTKKYTAEQLARELQLRAITLSINNGFVQMSFLSSELPFAINILHEILVNATFNDASIEKIRAQLLAHIDNYWDSAGNIAYQLKKNHLFSGQFLSKVGLGTRESIAQITRDDLMSFYKAYFSPNCAKLSIVGDLGAYDIEKELAPLSEWQGPQVADLPEVKYCQYKAKELSYYLDRDQLHLSFVRPSVKVTDVDYDALLILDQIMCPGLLNSMNNRLFQLREQSGAFYTIGGSVISNITGYSLAPRIVNIYCIVSLDRLHEVIVMIKDVIKHMPDSIIEEEIQTAKRAIAHAAVQAYITNDAIAYTFLFLDRYNLPFDYFDNRIDRLKSITLDQVKDAAKKLLNVDEFSVIKVGRI